MVAGGVAGVLQDAVYYPFETIKSRIQASSSKVDIMQANKGKSLFSGFSTVLYVSFPATALYFLGYDGTRLLFDQYRPQTNQHVSSMIAGIVAEVISNSFRNPFEVIKQQMQVGLDNSIKDTYFSIVRAKGFRGTQR